MKYEMCREIEFNGKKAIITFFNKGDGNGDRINVRSENWNLKDVFEFNEFLCTSIKDFQKYKNKKNL